MDDFTKHAIERVRKNGSNWFFRETEDRQLELYIIDKRGRIHTRLKLDDHGIKRFLEIMQEALNK